MKTYQVTVWDNGYITWKVNGQYHREDGPAFETKSGYKSWWINGKRHREDGPAIIWQNGRKVWYLNDKHLSEEEFNRRMAPKELTVHEIQNLLGYKIKVVEG